MFMFEYFAFIYDFEFSAKAAKVTDNVFSSTSPEAHKATKPLFAVSLNVAFAFSRSACNKVISKVFPEEKVCQARERTVIHSFGAVGSQGRLQHDRCEQFNRTSRASRISTSKPLCRPNQVAADERSGPPVDMGRLV